MFQKNYAALYITSQDKRMANFPMEGGKLSDFAVNHVSVTYTLFSVTYLLENLQTFIVYIKKSQVGSNRIG